MQSYNNWVIFCGLVRNLEAFLKKIEIVCDWKAQGLIQGAVYSTWEGELKNYPDLKEKLTSKGIRIIEISEPDLILTGHILHQMKTLHYALESCPDDAFVIKLRPDIGEIYENYTSFLKGQVDLEIDPNTNWPRIFEKKIVVHSGFILSPFYLHDIQYMGLNKDLKKLVNFDLKYEVLYSHLGPEQFLHSFPFIEVFPILKTSFQVNSGLIFNNEQISERILKICLDSSFYLKTFATYIHILNRYYKISPPIVGSDSLREYYISEQKEEKQPILTIFQKNCKVPGIGYHQNAGSSAFNSEYWIKAILNNGFKEDNLYSRIKEYLQEVSDWEFQKSWNDNPIYPQEEVIEFSKKISNLLGQRQKININRKYYNIIKISGDNPNWRVNSCTQSSSLDTEISQYRRMIDEMGRKLYEQQKEIEKLRDDENKLKQINNENILCKKAENNENEASLGIVIELSEEYIESGLYELSEAILKKAVNYYPDNVKILNNLSVIYIMENNYEKALGYINKVIELDSENKDAFENLKTAKYLMNRCANIVHMDNGDTVNKGYCSEKNDNYGEISAQINIKELINNGINIQNRNILISLYWNYHPRFRFLKTIKLNSIVLDMGAGDGGLVFWKKWNMPDRDDIKMLAIDLSEGKYFKGYDDYQIMDLNKDEIKYPDNNFDAIVLSHVLEHIQDEISLIKIIGRKLKNKGRCYIEIPTVESKYFPKRQELLDNGINISTLNFYDDYSHIQTYNNKELIKKMQDNGFKIIEAGKIDNRYLEDDLINYGIRTTDQELTTYGMWSKLGFAHYVVAEVSK